MIDWDLVGEKSPAMLRGELGVFRSCKALDPSLIGCFPNFIDMIGTVKRELREFEECCRVVSPGSQEAYSLSDAREITSF